MSQPEAGRLERGVMLDHPGMTIDPAYSADVVLPSRIGSISPPPQRVILVGSSTGGTEALKALLVPLPPSVPGILITQHMPERFVPSFASRLNALCGIRVVEAMHGEPVLPGVAYISPGNAHLMLGLRDRRYICELSDAPPVNRHRPSVDVLFRSAANVAGRQGIGIILTGMGRDGAAGMLEMKTAGCHNFAQDQQSCVIFGMPKEAIAMGGVHEVLPLTRMAPRLVEYLSLAPAKPV